MDKVDVKIGIAADYDDAGARQAEQGLKQVEDAARQAEQASAKAAQTAGSASAGGGQTGGSPTTALQQEQQAAAAVANGLAALGQAGQQAGQQVAEAAQQAAAALQEEQTAAADAGETLDSLGQGNGTGATEVINKLADALLDFAAAAQQAAESSDKQEKAQQNATDACQQEQEKSAALEQAMKLATQGKKVLVAELQKLAVARKEAAAAGDTAAYQKLTVQYKQVRTALQEVNNQAGFNKIALQGQAQAGLQFAQGLGSLAQQVRSGSTDLAGMATQVMGLGMALKTALGPIGWVMIALQGLQMAWDAWQGKKSESINRQIEASRQETEALLRAWQDLKDLSKDDQQKALESSTNEFTRSVEAASKKAEAERRQQAAALQEAAEADRHRLAMLEQEAAMDKSRIQTARLAGELTEMDAARQLAAVEEKLAAERKNIATLSAERQAQAKQQAAAISQVLADAYAEAAEKSASKYEPVMQVKLPEESELAEIERKLAELDEDSPAYQEAEKKKAEIVRIAAECTKALQQAGLAASSGWKENVAYVRQVQETVKEQTKVTGIKREEAAEAQRAASMASMLEASQKEELEAQERTRQAGREVSMATAARAQSEAAMQEEWQEVQRGTLEEQAAWLQETLSHLEEGSAAAKKWTEQLRAVKVKGIQDALSKIESQYRVTTDYARQDNRTQAQIHAADKKALQQRQSALEKLKACPDTDAATLKAINQKIKETNKQAAGLEKAMEASARAALQQVEAMKPQKLKASNKQAQSKLDALANAYDRMAKLAARAASKGDTKAEERYQKAMQKNALAQERITKYSGQAAAHHRKTVANLQAIAQGTAQEEKGMNSQQRRQRQIEKLLGVQQKNTQKAATEADKTAKAQEQLTKETKKQSQKTKKQTPAEKIENLNGEISSLKNTIVQCEQSMSALKTNLGGLVSVTGQVASAAASAAQTAANAVSTQQKAIERIQKQINRLNSKI